MRVGFFYGMRHGFRLSRVGLKFITSSPKQGVEVSGACKPELLRGGHLHGRRLRDGRMLADQNIKAFKDVDYIVTGCGTCSSTLKDYQKYLPDNEEQRKRYGEFEGKIKDSTEFVIDVLKVKPAELKLKKEFEGKTATWHDPCHLVRYQNIKDQPRAILKGLKGLKYVEMPKADMCCGMGGSFSVYHYDITKKIAGKEDGRHQADGRGHRGDGMPGVHDQPHGQHAAPQDAPEGLSLAGAGGVKTASGGPRISRAPLELGVRMIYLFSHGEGVCPLPEGR